jgi:hypothetical protein
MDPRTEIALCIEIARHGRQWFGIIWVARVICWLGRKSLISRRKIA